MPIPRNQLFAHHISALFAVLVLLAGVASASDYRAFSLAEAHKLLGQGRGNTPEVRSLGGITRPVACVFDDKAGDLILIGLANEAGAGIELDDFVVALRAVLKYGEAPLVSIDPPPQGGDPKNQVVRFGGHIENTRLGQDFLAADVVLKKLGLGQMSAELWRVRSYLDLAAEEWRRTGRENNVLSRFWFVSDQKSSAAATRDGIGLLKRLRLKVELEVSGASPRGTSPGTSLDPVGSVFAESLTAGLEDVMLAIPELRRLDQHFRLVGIASLIERWRDSGINTRCLDYWLNAAPIVPVKTPTNYPLLSASAQRESGSGSRNMTISGGVELRALVADIQSGSLTALRELVLKSRPGGDALTWLVPIGNALDAFTDADGGGVMPQAKPGSSNAGMSLRTHFGAMTPSSMATWSPPQFSPMSSRNSLQVTPLRTPQYTPKVGGVLLNDVASVKGEAGASEALGKGSFSVLVNGQDSLIQETAYRRFVTALWAVYFGREDPGISIDPIAKGAPKQLVRYIGNVENSDLGRVMREADYLMKKWAIGAERPSLKSFKTPDDHAKDLRTLYLGSMSRFWFVPENMTFKATPDALMFESGRITVKTEFLMSNAEGRKADPANERFAEWFTKHYHLEIAQQYPIYEELYDYAKLVALAKYLKESGIPLYWFLLANKDMVLTEQSPGTVDALFQKSKHFSDVTIEGGVNIVQKDVKTKGYVFDETARNAIRKAYEQSDKAPRPQSTTVQRPRYIAEPVSFQVASKDYTAIPMHSASSGKDRRGLRYQTDISLRTEGFEISPKVLEVLWPAILRRYVWDDLGGKMNDLEKAQSEGLVETTFNQAMQRAQDKTGDTIRKVGLIKGRFYSTEAEFAQGLGFALDDKDQLELLGDILVSYAKYYTSLDLVRVFDPQSSNEIGDFGDGWRVLLPYRLRPATTNRAKGYRLPSEMEVVNLIDDRREVLKFETRTNGVLGYFPPDNRSSEFVGAVVFEDGSFRLGDKLGAQFHFNNDGSIRKMIYTEDYVVGVEYLKKGSGVFEEAPYQVAPEDPDDRVEFRNVKVPKHMKVTNAFGTDQRLEFSDQKTPVGWYPPGGDPGKVRVLALMSDASYSLEDSRENEFLFDGAGHFTEVFVRQKEPVIRMLKMGRHRITFKYRLDPHGNIVIAKAWVSQDEISAKPQYVIEYDYDSTGRLANHNLMSATGKSVFGQ